MGPASRGRCRSEYHSVFAILAVVSNLHVIRICVGGAIIPDGLIATGLGLPTGPPHPEPSEGKKAE